MRVYGFKVLTLFFNFFRVIVIVLSINVEINCNFYDLAEPENLQFVRSENIQILLGIAAMT